AQLRIHLVGARGVDGVELLQDLVPLVDVSLVELVVGLDRRARDTVELVELGLQLPGGDLLELERKRGHKLSSLDWAGARSISSLQRPERSHGCPTKSRRCPTTTTPSSRMSTSRRCASTTTSTTRPTSTTPTRPSKGPNGPIAQSSRCWPTWRSCRRRPGP